MAQVKKQPRYNLELLGFPGQSEAVAVTALARAFGMKFETALEYVRDLPLTVVTEGTRESVAGYVEVLGELGADLRVFSLDTQESWTIRAPGKSAAPAPPAAAPDRKASAPAPQPVPPPRLKPVSTPSLGAPPPKGAAATAQTAAGAEPTSLTASSPRLSPLAAATLKASDPLTASSPRLSALGAPPPKAGDPVTASSPRLSPLAAATARASDSATASSPRMSALGGGAAKPADPLASQPRMAALRAEAKPPTAPPAAPPPLPVASKPAPPAIPRAEPKPADPRPTEPRSAEPRPAEPRPAETAAPPASDEPDSNPFALPGSTPADANPEPCPHCGTMHRGGSVCRSCGRPFRSLPRDRRGVLAAFTGEFAIPDEPLHFDAKAAKKAKKARQAEAEAEADAQPPPEADAAAATPPADLGIRTYAGHEVNSEQLDRMATGEFFVRHRGGRALPDTSEVERQHRRTWLTTLWERLVHPRGKGATPRTAAERAQARRRTRISLAVLGVLLLGAAALLVTRFLIAPAVELLHSSSRGTYAVSLPSRFEDRASNAGVFPSRIGRLPFATHTAVDRGNPLGALGFNLITLPASAIERYGADVIIESTLRAVVLGSSGEMQSMDRIEAQGQAGLESRYQARRFGRTFTGRVRVLRNENEVAVLTCEGSGDVCFFTDEAKEFFASYTFTPAGPED